MKSKCKCFIGSALTVLTASSLLFTGCESKKLSDDSQKDTQVIEIVDESELIEESVSDDTNEITEKDNEIELADTLEKDTDSKKDADEDATNENLKTVSEENVNQAENTSNSSSDTEKSNVEDASNTVVKNDSNTTNLNQTTTTEKDTVETNKDNTSSSDTKDVATSGNKTNTTTVVNKDTTTTSGNKTNTTTVVNKDTTTTSGNKTNTTTGTTTTGTTTSGNTNSGTTTSGNTSSGNTSSGNTNTGNTNSGNTSTTPAVKEHTHQYTTSVITKPKCTTDGLQASVCIICGDTVKEKIPSLGGHKFTTTVRKQPTCNSYGDQIVRCSTCGYSYAETFGELLPHTYTNIKSADTYSHSYTCSSCGQIIYESHNKSVYQTGSGANVKCNACDFDTVLCNYQELINREFALTNQARVENGLEPLTYNAGLQGLVNRRANEIISDFSHNGFEYVIANEWGNYPTFIGENIAYGYPTGDAVHTAWMNSPGHRSNILLADAKSIAIGVTMAPNGNLYWVQIFGLYP